MTPQEKAQQLMEAFAGKEGALRCVGEIGIAIDEVDEFEVQNLDRVHAFWDKVAAEICIYDNTGDVPGIRLVGS